MIPHASQVTALEPSWALRYQESELRGLLVLAALFNEKLYVHDTQLADHVVLLGSYLRRADDDLALFHLVHDLVEAGIVRVCLRDSVIVRRTEREVPVANLEELHEILSQRSDFGWVPAVHFPARKAMLSEFDTVITESEPFRYNYSALKQRFIETVRETASRVSTEHYRLLTEMPDEFRKSYEQLINKEWFSFIDIIDLCAKFGKRQHSEIIQSHGLIDEMCYAEWNRTRMLASNTSTWFAERDVSPVEQDSLAYNDSPVLYVGGRPSLLPLLQDKVISDIEVPGLVLLGTLSAKEILQIREKGRDFFRLREIPVANLQEAQRRFAETSLTYWDAICSFIRTSRPGLATDRTRLAVFLRKELPTLSSWGANAATFTIDLGLDTLGMLLPGLAVSDKLRERVHNLLSLRFLFYGESTEFKSLKDAIPDESWLLSRNVD